MRLLTLVLSALAMLMPPVLAEDKLPLPELFAERYPLTAAVLEADFPRDYSALRAQLAAVDKPEQIDLLRLSASFDAVTLVRKKYADRMLFAPPGALARLLNGLAEYYDAVFEGEGAATCAVFAQDGGGVLFRLGRSAEYAALIDRQSAAFFDAVVQAIETPEENGAVLPADWPALLGTMVGRGAPESYLASIAKGSSADPDLCPALAAIFRASAALDTPEGRRTRADFARNLAGY